MNSAKNIFALVDCNNFYASCERVFKPDIKNRAIVVLSNNDGCAIAMSNEAKALGIKIGTPYFKIASLVHNYNIKVFSSNYSLYGDFSNRVMEVLNSFSPEVEVYSIDESFMNLHGLTTNYKEYAVKIKTTVKKWTGIPVSVGIAETKTLAKLANRLAKKDAKYNGVFSFLGRSQNNINSILEKTQIEDLWGIGRQYKFKLNKFGIYNALQLISMPNVWIRKNVGGVVGLRTVNELKNVSCINLETVKADKKGIVSSRSFGIPVESLNDLEEALSSYVTRAAEKLRKQNSLTGIITVFLSTNRFKDEAQYRNSISLKLEEASSYTGDLIRYSLFLLNKIYKEGFRYKKTGIMFSELIPENCKQLDLFADKRDKNNSNIIQAVDKINNSQGKESISFASSGLKQRWRMKRKMLSKKYTSSWNDILTVKI